MNCPHCNSEDLNLDRGICRECGRTLDLAPVVQMATSREETERESSHEEAQEPSGEESRAPHEDRSEAEQGDFETRRGRQQRGEPRHPLPQEQRLGRIAAASNEGDWQRWEEEVLAAYEEGFRIVTLIGFSGAGKTFFANRLRRELRLSSDWTASPGEQAAILRTEEAIEWTEVVKHGLLQRLTAHRMMRRLTSYQPIQRLVHRRYLLADVDGEAYRRAMGHLLGEQGDVAVSRRYRLLSALASAFILMVPAAGLDTKPRTGQTHGDGDRVRNGPLPTNDEQGGLSSPQQAPETPAVVASTVAKSLGERPPTITSVDPMFITVESDSATLTIRGSALLASSVVIFKGREHSPVLNADGSLTVSLNGRDLTEIGKYSVHVKNSPSATSNAVVLELVSSETLLERFDIIVGCVLALQKRIRTSGDVRAAIEEQVTEEDVFKAMRENIRCAQPVHVLFAQADLFKDVDRHDRDPYFFAMKSANSLYKTVAKHFPTHRFDFVSAFKNHVPDDKHHRVNYSLPAYGTRAAFDWVDQMLAARLPSGWLRRQSTRVATTVRSIIDRAYRRDPGRAR